MFASALLRIGNYAPECMFLFGSLYLYIVLFVRQSFNSHSMLHVISQGVTPTGTVGLGSSLRTIVLAAQDLQINFIVCYKDIFQ